MKDLNAEAVRVHVANKKWWTNLETGEYPIERNTEELLMLVISELAEAMEGDRKNLMDDKLPHRPMREVELADALIRLLDIAGAYHISLTHLGNRFFWSESFAANLYRLTTAVTAGVPLRSIVYTGVWMILSLANHYEMDLLGAYEEKMQYNANREDHSIEHRKGAHGKKY